MFEDVKQFLKIYGPLFIFPTIGIVFYNLVNRFGLLSSGSPYTWLDAIIGLIMFFIMVCWFLTISLVVELIDEGYYNELL